MHSSVLALVARVNVRGYLPRIYYGDPVAEAVDITIDGRSLRLTNLSKVLYPATGHSTTFKNGFTKADVVDYYRQIAPFMLPHLAGLCPTMVRAPDGFGGEVFFEKRCPRHHPDWIDTGAANGVSGGCFIDSLPALIWTANLAALELHTQQTPAASLRCPRAMVFDLDPGDGATVMDCRRVALQLHGWLLQLGLDSLVKTSGSKGLHLSVPLNDPALTDDDTKQFALTMGQLFEQRDPLVTTTMAKAERGSKVFIDWSQNDRHKTTVAPYSLRIRETPTVSTPITWEELSAATTAEELTFDALTVIERVATFGDLWSANLTLAQQLPQLG